MYMASNCVEVKVTPPVGTVLLNRPDADNTVTLPMVEELRQAIGDLHLEKRVRAVILTGAGEVFCRGRDLLEMAAEHQQDSPDDPSQQHQRWGEQASDLCDLVVDLLSFPKPLIAAVNGPVSGFGVALMTTSDLVIAVESASLEVPDTRHGLVAGLVAPLVAYRVGAGTAARLAVAGQSFDSAEAYRLGLYHELVPHHLLWARGMELGTAAAAGAPQAINLTKRLLLETVGEKLLTDLASGAIASATARTTDVAQEGLRAVAEQRPPKWD